MKIFFQNFDRNHFPREAAEKLKCYKRIIFPYLERKMPIKYLHGIHGIFVSSVEGFSKSLKLKRFLKSGKEWVNFLINN